MSDEPTRPDGLWADPPAPADGDQPGPLDARSRPPDPAGTRPRFDPDGLLPTAGAPLLRSSPADADTDAVEIDGGDDGDLLPQRLPAGGAGAVAAAGRDAPAPHAPRFQFALGGLIALGLAGVAVLVIALTGLGGGSSDDDQVRWSSWRPVDGAGDPPTQIAEHVAREYRLPDGHQIVLATGGAMEIAGLPLTVVKREAAAQGGDITPLEGKGVLYRLCGLGEKCAIATGKPSAERLLLLRREALEMALYSFRYIKGVDQVTVFLPPPKGSDPDKALFFRKGDVEQEVREPLTATLTPEAPSVARVAVAPDAARVDGLTTRSLFKASFTQANQDARAFLVLDPPLP